MYQVQITTMEIIKLTSSIEHPPTVLETFLVQKGDGIRDTEKKNT